MPALRALAPRLLVAVVLCTGLASCGAENKKLIAESRADALLRDLDRIERSVEADRCDTAQRQVNEAVVKVQALPRSTDRRLRNNLEEWYGQLAERIVAECGQEAEPTPTATETPEETTTPEPTPTETETPEPTPTETQTPEPTPTEQPPDDGGVSPPEEGAIQPIP
jgi:outer membrane biosynthesis protein TonB